MSHHDNEVPYADKISLSEGLQKVIETFGIFQTIEPNGTHHIHQRQIVKPGHDLAGIALGEQVIT